MLYAVKVGPLETAEGRITAYCGFSESGMAPPVFADGDAEGLRGLRDAAGDVELRCEKRLEREAQVVAAKVFQGHHVAITAVMSVLRTSWNSAMQWGGQET